MTNLKATIIKKVIGETVSKAQHVSKVKEVGMLGFATGAATVGAIVAGATLIKKTGIASKLGDAIKFGKIDEEEFDSEDIDDTNAVG